MATNRRCGGHGSIHNLIVVNELAQVEEDLALREVEASASLIGFYIVIHLDDIDEDDKDYTLPSSSPPFPRAAHDDEAGGSGVARDDIPLPITSSETNTTSLGISRSP